MLRTEIKYHQSTKERMLKNCWTAFIWLTSFLNSKSLTYMFFLPIKMAGLKGNARWSFRVITWCLFRLLVIWIKLTKWFHLCLYLLGLVVMGSTNADFSSFTMTKKSEIILVLRKGFFGNWPVCLFHSIISFGLRAARFILGVPWNAPWSLSTLCVQMVFSACKILPLLRMSI